MLGPPVADVVLVPRRGLNCLRLLPLLGSLYLNPQPRSPALASPPLCAVLKRQLSGTGELPLLSSSCRPRNYRLLFLFLLPLACADSFRSPSIDGLGQMAFVDTGFLHVDQKGEL